MQTDLWQNLVRGTGQALSALTGGVVSFGTLPGNMPVRAVLTDFDGVISDNNRTLAEAYQQLRTQMPDLPPAEVALAYKNNPLAFFHRELSHVPHEVKKLVYTTGRQLYEHTPMHLLNSAEQTMDQYAQKQIPWAVVSNNHMTEQRWHELGLDARYPGVPVIGNAQKPSSRAMVTALQSLGQQPGQDVLMVDDEWKGLTVAAEMGLTPVYMGERAHIVLPMVSQACKERGIEMPHIPVVRNNAELRQLVVGGVEPVAQMQRAF